MITPEVKTELEVRDMYRLVIIEVWSVDIVEK